MGVKLDQAFIDRANEFLRADFFQKSDAGQELIDQYTDEAVERSFFERKGDGVIGVRLASKRSGWVTERATWPDAKISRPEKAYTQDCKEDYSYCRPARRYRVQGKNLIIDKGRLAAFTAGVYGFSRLYEAGKAYDRGVKKYPSQAEIFHHSESPSADRAMLDIAMLTFGGIPVAPETIYVTEQLATDLGRQYNLLEKVGTSITPDDLFSAFTAGSGDEMEILYAQIALFGFSGVSDGNFKQVFALFDAAEMAALDKRIAMLSKHRTAEPPPPPVEGGEADNATDVDNDTDVGESDPDVDNETDAEDSEPAIDTGTDVGESDTADPIQAGLTAGLAEALARRERTAAAAAKVPEVSVALRDGEMQQGAFLNAIAYIGGEAPWMEEWGLGWIKEVPRIYRKYGVAPLKDADEFAFLNFIDMVEEMSGVCVKDDQSVACSDPDAKLSGGWTGKNKATIDWLTRVGVGTIAGSILYRGLSGQVPLDVRKNISWKRPTALLTAAAYKVRYGHMPSRGQYKAFAKKWGPFILMAYFISSKVLSDQDKFIDVFAPSLERSTRDHARSGVIAIQLLLAGSVLAKAYAHPLWATMPDPARGPGATKSIKPLGTGWAGLWALFFTGYYFGTENSALQERADVSIYGEKPRDALWEFFNVANWKDDYTSWAFLASFMGTWAAIGPAWGMVGSFSRAVTDHMWRFGEGVTSYLGYQGRYLAFKSVRANPPQPLQASTRLGRFFEQTTKGWHYGGPNPSERLMPTKDLPALTNRFRDRMQTMEASATKVRWYQRFYYTSMAAGSDRAKGLARGFPRAFFHIKPLAYNTFMTAVTLFSSFGAAMFSEMGRDVPPDVVDDITIRPLANRVVNAPITFGYKAGGMPVFHTDMYLAGMLTWLPWYGMLKQQGSLPIVAARERAAEIRTSEDAGAQARKFLQMAQYLHIAGNSVGKKVERYDLDGEEVIMRPTQKEAVAAVIAGVEPNQGMMHLLGKMAEFADGKPLTPQQVDAMPQLLVESGTMTQADLAHYSSQLDSVSGDLLYDALPAEVREKIDQAEAHAEKIHAAEHHKRVNSE